MPRMAPAPDQPASACSTSATGTIETAAGERISYADLVARTGKMANALVGFGVKPGDALYLPPDERVKKLRELVASIHISTKLLFIAATWALAVPIAGWVAIRQK